MGTIVTSSHPKLLWPGLKLIWGQMYDEHKEEYPHLFDIIESRQAYEQMAQIIGAGLATIKSQNAPIQYADETQGWVTTYSPIAYASGFIVSKEEIEDNLYEKVAAARARNLAFAMRQTMETVAAFLYNQAFNSNFYTMPDGVGLCSTSHSIAGGATLSNRLSTDANLSEVSLEDAIIMMQNFTDDNGLQINVKPKTLITSTHEIFNAARITKSVLQSNSAGNNINAMLALNSIPEGAIVNHYLTSAGAFFVRSQLPPGQGMTFFMRNKPDLEMDNDDSTRNARTSSYMRFAVGATDPRAIIGSNGP